MTALITAPAPIETANMPVPGHTARCSQRLAALDAYLDRWPRACVICAGWGFHAGGDCPNCVLLGICPRCSANLVETGRCSACQWEDGATGFLPVIGGSQEPPELPMCDPACSGRQVVIIAVFDGRSGRWTR